MMVREPVLTSAVAAIPAARLTRLFSISMWIRSSEIRVDASDLLGALEVGL